MKEIGFNLAHVPIIWCVNLSVSSLDVNPIYHTQTKHIKIDVHFVLDRVLEKKVDVWYVPSLDQIAHSLRLSYTQGSAFSRTNSCSTTILSFEGGGVSI